jgi:hypothetical protein
MFKSSLTSSFICKAAATDPQAEQGCRRSPPIIEAHLYTNAANNTRNAYHAWHITSSMVRYDAETVEHLLPDIAVTNNADCLVRALLRAD